MKKKVLATMLVFTILVGGHRRSFWGGKTNER